MTNGSRPRTIWELLAVAVQEVDEPFGREELFEWFRTRHPHINLSSVSTHLQYAASNSASTGRDGFKGRTPLVTRVGRGRYVRFDAEATPVETGGSPLSPVAPVDVEVPSMASPSAKQDFDVVLVSCVAKKLDRPAPARDLYDSDLFRKQRAFAERTRLPWFILSAEHGLVRPDDWLAPYELYLPKTPASYRVAWGGWVAERLEFLIGPLANRTVAVLAGAHYVEPLRGPLLGKGVRILEPLSGLSFGPRLAWYNEQQVEAPSAPSADDLTAQLVQHSAALTPEAFRRGGSLRWQSPGLYTWWVDDSGAGHLTAGLGHCIEAGLIYLGQAGATRWPSGKRSSSTLWSRISGMHLGQSEEFSTLRRSLLAVLVASESARVHDEKSLSEWMDSHLTMIAVPVDDRDSLESLERSVLAALDPPLNSKHMPSTPVRERLREMRRQRVRDFR